MKAQALRNAFLSFFEEKKHTLVASSPVIPANDKTLLFTNAGMVQFKDVFLGQESRPYQRATSVQCCIRAGGKHNDLENVGFTARHHTFFEMLGNFSFGDYFKREAIHFAWEFLTEVVRLPKEKLWVTVFETDDEAADIWLKEVGVDPARFSRCGAKDNFWSMGDTGPCGPCTEIFYDHGPSIAGGPPGTPEADGDRYIEIWNLVFMQYDRNTKGDLTPLPKPSVDTGMGLERLAAILQGVHNNYDIDIFKHLIEAAAQVVEVSDLAHPSLKVIADHIRSCSFIILDGVLPANEDRGYVLRRIIRRAIRHGFTLGQKEAFFYKLVKPLTEVMGEAYPALVQKAEFVAKVLAQEEMQFAKTLAQGMRLVEEAIAAAKNKTIAGDTAFRLYDTYGFPLDLTIDFAREKGFTVDEAGFEKAMQVQRERAREASTFKADEMKSVPIEASSRFIGYEHLDGESAVLAIFKDGKWVDGLDAGENAAVVLARTPFYAESGGQIGDSGTLSVAGGWFVVEDTQKQQNAILHIGHMTSGEMKVGMTAYAEVSRAKRRATMRHHSATHLMHAALREILGEGVVQKGSLVTFDRLRFDFSYPNSLSADEIEAIENRVNTEILKNTQADILELPIEEAKKAGAMALFGEKYGDIVRVLRMGNNFSIELCGGTHVKATGDIGLFKIISQSSVAAGIRRIEAVVGDEIIHLLRQQMTTLNEVALQLKAEPSQIVQKLNEKENTIKLLEKKLKEFEKNQNQDQAKTLIDRATEQNGIFTLVEAVSGDITVLRELMDALKTRLSQAVIVLLSEHEGKVVALAGVTQNLTAKIKAGDIMARLAPMLGGKGGGRPDLAQGGGSDTAAISGAIVAIKSWILGTLDISTISDVTH